jgi:hypothetical protein
MTSPVETESGSAGVQPCGGIIWWALHTEDPHRLGGIFPNGKRHFLIFTLSQ